MIARSSKSLMSLNGKLTKYSFCFGKALLNPYKHTTMSHTPHNMFVDLYDFGEYPQVIAPASIPSKAYQPVVVSTLVTVLNSQYGTSLTADDITNNFQKPLTRFIAKNLNSTHTFDEVIAVVLNKLAMDVIVKESKWTWIKEQKERLTASSIYFSHNNPENLGDFVSGYNALIEELVLASSYGLSPHIPQAPTPLEKHYAEEMRASQNEGVDELNELQGDKDNFINRAMAFIHRI